MNRPGLKGVMTALATPFFKEGELDRESFLRLLRWQMKQGVSGFVVGGTTGESPCISSEELKNLVLWTKAESQEKKLLIVGAGTNSTKTTIKNLHQAREWGVHAALVVVPYYNKPSQRGLVHHFTACADSTDLPLLLYNVPSRTGVGLSLQSVLELSRHPRILGIKEASGDLKWGKELLKQRPKGFVVLSGDDFTMMKLCTLGAEGGICVASHILGSEMVGFLNRIQKGDFKASGEYIEKYGAFLKALYCESNPVGIKEALRLKGVFQSSQLRSPLVELLKEQVEHLKSQIQAL